ncbi:MAG: TatD family hydrolase [Anaerolineae bacterium]|nr:TatD family hydrolase [Anaerolineae bacterium]
MPLIDTHCHLNLDAFDGIRDTIVREAAEHGVTRIIIPGIDLTTSREALDLADTYPGIYAAVGIQPNSAGDFDPSMIEELRALAAHPKAVAIGEIGLDYHWDTVPKAIQTHAFEAQLRLAAELNLPVIIHNREAGDDVLAVLETWAADLPEPLVNRPGVLHSFSASQTIADRALAIDFYLGFTGPVTFKKADDLRQIAAGVPDDRILVETDSPYLTPHPFRGRRPNTPAHVRFIAARLADLRGLTETAFADLSTANAERLFALPPFPDNTP